MSVHRRLVFALLFIPMLLSALVGAGAANAALSAGAVHLGDLTPSVTTLRYGPYTVPAATGMPAKMQTTPGSAMPGMDQKPMSEMDNMGMFQSRLQLNVAKACNACFLTSMTPGLVYADGSDANIGNGAWLHHMVWWSQSPTKFDATCGTTPMGLLGQRFFATGNERTRMALPSGYGYPVTPIDRWNAVTELMNMNPKPITVYVTLTVVHVPLTAALTPVRPVWLDERNCESSEFAIPAGQSDTTWNWKADIPGHIVAMGGHLHDTGTHIYAVDDTTGQVLCNSIASYGLSKSYVDMDGMEHVSRMSGCFGDPVATVNMGDKITLHALYDSPQPQQDVMGIMLAYIAPARSAPSGLAGLLSDLF